MSSSSDDISSDDSSHESSIVPRRCNCSFYFIGSAGDWAPKSSRKKRSQRQRSGDFLDGVYGDWIEISKALKQKRWEVSGASISVGAAAKPQEELRKLQSFADQQGKRVKLLYYSGHGQKGTGDWAFDGGSVGLQDVLGIFGRSEKRRRTSNGEYRVPVRMQTLIMVADCCYAGQWAEQLVQQEGRRLGFAIILVFASGPNEYATDGLLRQVLLKGENSKTMRELARHEAGMVWMSPAGQLVRKDLDDHGICRQLQSWLFKGAALPEHPSDVLVEAGPAAVLNALGVGRASEDPRIATAALHAATQLDSDDERSSREAEVEIRRITRYLRNYRNDVEIARLACDALARRVNDKNSQVAAINGGTIECLVRVIRIHKSAKTSASRELLKETCKAFHAIIRGRKRGKVMAIMIGRELVENLTRRKGPWNAEVRNGASRLLGELAK